MRILLALLLTVSVANAATLAGITNVYGIFPRGGISIPSVINLETELANRPTSPDVLNILAAATAEAATTNYVNEFVTNYVGTNIPSGVITNGQDITTTIPGLTNIAIAAVDGLADFVSTNGSSGNAITNYDTREIVLSNNFTVATGEPAWVGIYSNNVLIASIDGTNSYQGNGNNLTNLAADKLGTGIVPTARLGSGTANAGTALFGDGTWKGVYTNGPNDSLAGYGSSGVPQSITPGSGLSLSGGVLSATNSGGGVDFDISVTWATSNDTETVVWDASGDEGKTYRYGPVMVVGSGPTNYISGTIQDSIFRREPGGSTTWIGSNTTTWIRSDAGIEARFRKATGNAMELTVKGFANENMNWSLKGFATEVLNAAPEFAESGDISTLTNGLVAFWKLDETSGTRNDAWTNGYNMTDGNVGYTNGILSNAAFLTNNANQDLYSSDRNQFSALNGGSLSAAGWFRLGRTNASIWILNKATTTSGGYEWRSAFLPDYMRINFGLYTNATAAGILSISVTNTSFVVNDWYFWASVIDATNKVTRIWLGTTNTATTAGIFDGRTSAQWSGFGPDGNGTNTAADLYIGANNGTSQDTSAFDNMAIWSRALTGSEVTNLWQNKWMP